MTPLIWLGIALCISQSAMFSGLNLACFSVSKLRLEMEADKGSAQARKLLALRADANLLLTTILWGNVSVNVLLALLSNSVLTGVAAFLFSTIVITFVGEILPQGYFSRNAIRMASLLSPMLRFYQLLLYPVAKPAALFLDWWLGPEAIKYYEEQDLRGLIKKHVQAAETDIAAVEGTGALNFLTIDDLPVNAEGESIDPDSIITLPFRGGRPVFPDISRSTDDPFLQSVQRSGHKWVILLDEEQQPRMALNAHTFLRDALFNGNNFSADTHCHRPIIVHNGGKMLGELIPQFRVKPESSEDDVVDEDIIILWTDDKRVITGSDILGRLLRGIVQNVNIGFRKYGPDVGSRTSDAKT